MRLLSKATQEIGKYADIEITDIHHRDKVDAPSGTALQIGEMIAKDLGGHLKKRAVHGRYGKTGARAKGSIGFHAIRAGEIVGEHKVLFALDGEQMEINHTVNKRSSFARGAVAAALWLHKQSKGLHTMGDFLTGNA